GAEGAGRVAAGRVDAGRVDRAVRVGDRAAAVGIGRAHERRRAAVVEDDVVPVAAGRVGAAGDLQREVLDLDVGGHLAADGVEEQAGDVEAVGRGAGGGADRVGLAELVVGGVPGGIGQQDPVAG